MRNCGGPIFYAFFGHGHLDLVTTLGGHASRFIPGARLPGRDIRRAYEPEALRAAIRAGTLEPCYANGVPIAAGRR